MSRLNTGLDAGQHRSVIDVDELRRHLDGVCDPDVDLDRLAITYIKLRSDGPVLAVLEAPAGAGRSVLFTARWTPQARGEHLTKRLNRQPRPRSGGLSNTAVHLVDLGLVIISFPHDRRLPSLHRVMDDGFLALWLTRMVGPDFGDTVADDVEIRPVRYKPEGKCVLAVTVDWRGGNEDLPGTVYAKVSKPAIFERSSAVLAHLDRIAAATGFEIPSTLGLDPDLHLEVAAEAPGRSMAEVLATGAGIGVGATVGASLGRLHRSSIRLPANRSDRDRAEHLADNVAQLARHCPSQRVEIEQIGEGIEGRLAGFGSRPGVCCHNDFHGGNVLITPYPALIDFEDAANGDPLNDVASMYAHLMALAADHPARRATIDAERRAFLDTYDPHDPNRLAAWVAMHCILLAYQSLRHPGPTSSRRIVAMIDAAGTVLTEGVS